MNKTGERQIVLKVGGMTCGHCAARVQKALDGISDVVEATVDLDSGTTDIRYGADTDIPALIAAVEEAGYTAGAA